VSSTTLLCGHLVLEAIDGTLPPAPASDYKHVATGTLYWYMAMRLMLMQIPSLNSSTSPIHMHHRHIDHALTSRTRLWRTPEPNSSHPYADVVVGVVVARLLGNRQHPITKSFHIPLSQSHRVRRKHHRNVTRRTQPGSFFPMRSVHPEHRVREARRVVLPS
jgi:hypothetical protein